MYSKRTLTRAVTREECPWLHRDFAEGETVYDYHGPTYGAISPAGRAVSEEPGKTPFLEIPRAALSLSKKIVDEPDPEK